MSESHHPAELSLSDMVISDEIEVFRTLSRQAGAELITDGIVVFKEGDRVQPNEFAAMVLATKYACAPVPEPFFPDFKEGYGTFGMPFAPGEQLGKVWDSFDNETKLRICTNIWTMITKWRQIPKPSAYPYQCLADGSTRTRDKLLQSLDTNEEPITSDTILRERIYERYHHFNGRRYENELPDMLPRSTTSVFTHGDVAPQNILVDQQGNITAILDWEHAGWYPDYWEYANIMKPRRERDWQQWMDATKPKSFEKDLSGITAARRVLF